MCNRLVMLLKSYHAYLIDNNIYKKSNFVFSPLYTISLKEHHFFARKKYLCKTTGFNSIWTQNFRHSCAPLLIYKGTNINTVSKLLGYTKKAKTLNTYTQNVLTDITSIIDDMNEELGNF